MPRGSTKAEYTQARNSSTELKRKGHPPKRVNNPEARGLRHLAFEVDDIEDERKKLLSYNIECEEIRIDEITGKKFTFFKDPDGLPLELYEY